MSSKTTFTAQLRTLEGKKNRRLRKSGVLPANVHGNVDHPLTIQVDSLEFAKLYDRVGDTGVIYLTVADETSQRPVLIDQVDYNPITGAEQHVVFKQVNLKEKVTAEVPILFEGENKVPDSVVVEVVSSVPVEALPTDLPEHFVVDVTTLTEIGQSITYADLKFDKEVVALMIEAEQIDEPVVILQAQAVEEPEEAPAEEAVAEATPEASATEETTETKE